MQSAGSRRDFLSTGAALAGGLLWPRLLPAPHAGEARRPLRVGIVGVGERGRQLLHTLLALPGVEIPALCDVDEAALHRAETAVDQAGRPRPQAYGGHPVAYRRLCEHDDLDLVVVATPWRLHVPVALHAMKAGRHVALEVPAASTLEDCWKLVETAERTRRHCVLLENCCYFRRVMMLLAMVREGLLGQLVHCEAGYQHDARYVAFNHEGRLLWRGEEAAARDGNLYPTHPLGPVAQWMNVNRGDAFDYLVSMSSASRGLNLYAEEHFGAGHRLARRRYAQGDVNTTLIRTRNGLTITLYYDTQLPRPYDLIYRVQGTRGIYSGTLDRIYLAERSPQVETWEEMASYEEEFEHPLWRALGERARGFGHGGADYVMLARLVDCLQTGRPPDIDVYDAAAWSAIAPLSERSVARGSRPEKVPDFTRGAWKRRPPLAVEAI